MVCVERGVSYYEWVWLLEVAASEGSPIETLLLGVSCLKGKGEGHTVIFYPIMGGRGFPAGGLLMSFS